MLRRVGVALAGAAIVAALAAAGGIGALRVYEAPGPLQQARDVVVPHGRLDTVAQALAAAGVVDNPMAFRIAAAVTARRGPLHAAELAFPRAASLRQVLAVLRTAPPVQHHLTIPEGLTAAQIAELLAHAEAMTGDAGVPAEGAVLPDTYDYEYGAPRAALLRRAEAAMDRALARAWADRAPDLPLTTPQQALVLASIVERETARPQERAHVAAVFLNRLRLGMKLQADPTVIYGASGGMGSLDRPLSHADLERDGPYNTYRIAGLPPAPICAPGIASLLAATRPAASDDLYFVADGNGGHSFARTLEVQNGNVARWRERKLEPPR